MQFVVCINNTDYSASLEIRKIYQVVPDSQANNHHQIRVIDESGEDYLYPSDYFMALELSEPVQQALATCL
jgi:hypothetical protein